MTVASIYDAFDKAPQRPQEPTGAVVRLPVGEATRYGAKALQNEAQDVAATAEGGRNARLNKAGWSLAQLVAAGHLTEDEVRETLGSAARAAGLDDHEIIATLRSSLGAGIQHPREVPELPPAPPATTLSQLVSDAADAGVEGAAEYDLDARVRETLPIIDWHELWTREDDEEWILEPLLPARRLIALYSAPKVGKSLLMLELAVAIARGTSALGVTPDRPRRVLYVDFENDPQADIRERLIAMGHGPDDLDNLCYLSFPSLATLDSANGGLELMAAAETYGCEVVVVDTVSRAIAGEENENDTWLAFYRHTGKALKAAGVSLVRLDHSGKDQDKGQRGGSAKSGDVDAVWRLKAVTDDTFQLDCEANRMPVAERSLVLHRHQFPLRHDVDPTGRVAAWNAKVEAVIGALDAAGADKETGSTKAREIVRAAGLKARNEVIAEALRKRRITL